ncbi:MAG: galactokinase [Flavobacteriaceae bacterium]|nr:galactokinase [Flavobacteriaceae bacterium]
MSDKIHIKSPGRLNLIGEHTDYNGGYVLPCAINLSVDLYFEISKKKSNVITDLGYSMKFDVKENYIKSEIHWENYVLGVVQELKKIKHDLINFNCDIKSTLPSGSGISSSSALVCGLIKGLCILNDIELDNSGIIDLSRNVEHKYIGVLGGIMDQFTILNAKKNTAILLDCSSLKVKYIDLDLKDYELLLLNTNVKHNLANTQYNNRVIECKQALEIINKLVGENYLNLSNASLNELSLAKNKLSKENYNRALFVLRENKRAVKAAELLEKNDLMQFGELMYASHYGLKNNYEVSCKELDYLVEATREYKDILGARMMGGGFGGCTINLINKNFTKKFIKIITQQYKLNFKLDLGVIIAKPQEGLKIIK